MAKSTSTPEGSADRPLPDHHPQIVALREEHHTALLAAEARASAQLEALGVVVQRARQLGEAAAGVVHQIPCTRNVNERGRACPVCDVNEASKRLTDAMRAAKVGS